MDGVVYTGGALRLSIKVQDGDVHFTLEQIGLKSVGATGGYTCQDVFDPTHPIVTYTLKEQIVLYVPPNGIKMFRCYPLDFVDLPYDDAIQIL